MSWFGKLVGGALGFAIGGPLGALVGAGIGHGFDTGLDELGRESGDEAPQDVRIDPRERAQMAFFTATFAVMGHVAKADGRVSEEEIELARTVMDRLGLDADMRRAARDLFARGKAPDFPLDDVLSQLRRESRFSRNLQQMFLEIQLHAALADGVIHPAERSILDHIGHCLGFDPEDLAQLEALVRAADAEQRDDAAAARPPPLERDYATLGLSPAASDPDVKRAYRRLMSQHHPDKLVSKGLPDEMIRVATERTQQIKAAYERVRDARAAGG